MFGAFGRPTVHSATLGTPPVAPAQPEQGERLDWLSAGHGQQPVRGKRYAGSSIFSILDRYMISELVPPLGFAIAAFTLFMLINSLVLAADFVINKGVPAGLIARYLVLQLPSLMYLILPFGCLFSILLGIGRLAGENELAAMRTSGISLQRIALPCYVLGVVMTFIAFFINEEIAPRSQAKGVQLFRQIAYHSTQAIIQPYQFFRTSDGQHVIYIQSVDSGTGVMHNVQVFNIGAGYWPETLTARLGQQLGGKLVLQDGVVTTTGYQGTVTQVRHFDKLEFPLGDTSLLYSPQSAFETNSRELRLQIQNLKQVGQDVTQLEMNLQQKYAMPAACLVSVLIALPFGIRFGKRGRGVAAIMSIVLMLCYYLIMATTIAFGKSGVLNPFLAAWAPNILIGSAGLTLLLLEER
jgi:lipopolysaccharide export system permease protein